MDDGDNNCKGGEIRMWQTITCFFVNHAKLLCHRDFSAHALPPVPSQAGQIFGASRGGTLRGTYLTTSCSPRVHRRPTEAEHSGHLRVPPGAEQQEGKQQEAACQGREGPSGRVGGQRGPSKNAMNSSSKEKIRKRNKRPQQNQSKKCKAHVLFVSTTNFGRC